MGQREGKKRKSSLQHDKGIHLEEQSTDDHKKFKIKLQLLPLPPHLGARSFSTNKDNRIPAARKQSEADARLPGRRALGEPAEALSLHQHMKGSSFHPFEFSAGRTCTKASFYRKNHSLALSASDFQALVLPE